MSILGKILGGVFRKKEAPAAAPAAPALSLIHISEPTRPY